jgi:glycosyltransferase involved in cell wall biosynthesis
MSQDEVLTKRRRIIDSTFVVVTNGFNDGPAQALREYLLERDARRVTFVNHPLTREEPSRHVVTTQSNDDTATVRSYRLPNLVPYTFALDPLVPIWPPRTTAWFGFNNLAALRGLAARRLGRADAVYYWAVDFVPSRFGAGLLTAAYEKADRIACVNADARIELSATALQARTESLGLGVDRAPAITIPMGAWTERTPTATAESWSNCKLVYLGHLVERQGVAHAIEAIPLLKERHPHVTLEIIGDGPQAGELHRLASKQGVGDIVHFHGRVERHEDVEHILAGGTVALAPYLERADNFTQFADPGKLKSYLAAGLPIVLTAVPPNAHELEAAGVALLSQGAPAAFASSIERFLADRDLWLSAHQRALEYAGHFDWNSVLDRGLGELGWE